MNSEQTEKKSHSCEFMQKHESYHVHNRVTLWARSEAVQLCLPELGPLWKCKMLKLGWMKMHLELHHLGLDVIEITVFLCFRSQQFSTKT